MLFLVLLSTLVSGIAGFFQGPSAANAFVASWTIDMSYNASFQDLDIPGYNPPPFLTSSPISPLSGKIAFNYPTAEVYLEINEGEGAPWKLHTATIVHSTSCKQGSTTFNCSVNIYQTAGLDMCWFYSQNLINIPNQMGGNLNLTYNGTAKVGTQDCMRWRTPGGSVFFVSLANLAVLEIDLPYLLNQVAPIFGFFGVGNALTSIKFYDVVVGTPAQSYFAIPKGSCINTTLAPPLAAPDIAFSDLPSSHFKKLFGGEGSLFSSIANANPMRWLSKKLDVLSEKSLSSVLSAKKRNAFQPRRENAKAGPFPPTLNQIFSANWFLNASQDIQPPYQPYTLSGTLAMDFIHSGISIALTGQSGNLPIQAQFEWRLYPSRNGIEWLQVGPDGETCYSYIYFQWIFTLLIPQFEIPFSAAQEPPVVINGEKCSVWQTTYDWFENYSELFVRESDNTIIQITLPEPYGQGLATLSLSDVKTTVSPSAYARPAKCVETTQWNPAWESHLPWDWCDPYC